MGTFCIGERLALFDEREQGRRGEWGLVLLMVSGEKKGCRGTSNSMSCLIPIITSVCQFIFGFKVTKKRLRVIL